MFFAILLKIFYKTLLIIVFKLITMITNIINVRYYMLQKMLILLILPISFSFAQNDTISNPDQELTNSDDNEIRFQQNAGLSLGVPIPFFDTGTKRLVALEPGLSYGLLFDFAWGKLNFEFILSFTLYEVENDIVYEDWVGFATTLYNWGLLTIPLVLDISYYTDFDPFYFLFTGMQGGAAFAYAEVIEDDKAGLLAYLSIGGGAGLNITEFFIIKTGIYFDILFFANVPYYNIKPILGLNLLF